MKRIEIIVSSAMEEEISLEIMQGVYGALLTHGYDGISINTESIQDGERDRQEMAKKFRIPEFQVPEFIRRQNYAAAVAGRR